MAAPGRGTPGPLQIEAQRKMVVNLAIESQYIAATSGMHGLVPSRRQVEDGEAAVRQTDAGYIVGPHAAIIRSAVLDSQRHADSHSLEAAWHACVRAQEPGESAHALLFPMIPLLFSRQLYSALTIASR